MLWTELGGNFYATGIDESNRCMPPWAGLMEIQARRASEGSEPSLACASGLY